jgi:hypothetical protein
MRRLKALIPASYAIVACLAIFAGYSWDPTPCYGAGGGCGFSQSEGGRVFLRVGLAVAICSFWIGAVDLIEQKMSKKK